MAYLNLNFKNQKKLQDALETKLLENCFNKSRKRNIDGESEEFELVQKHRKWKFGFIVFFSAFIDKKKDRTRIIRLTDIPTTKTDTEMHN